MFGADLPIFRYSLLKTLKMLGGGVKNEQGTEKT
jgi:hypothetical protein